MFAPRSSFLIAAIAVLALIAAAEVDADKSARNARQLKGGKSTKSPKSPKRSKSPKSGSETTPPVECVTKGKCAAPAVKRAVGRSDGDDRRLGDDGCDDAKCCEDRRLAHEIVASIGGDPKGAFYQKDSIITKDATERLLKMSEEKYSLDDFDPMAPHHQQEWRADSNLIPESLALYELSGEELVDAIGKDNSKAILAFIHESFGGAASVSKISLQHANMEEKQMHFSPHMDKMDTALVFLGGSDANIVYLNADGESEVITYPGKAVAHGGSTVHSEYSLL